MIRPGGESTVLDDEVVTTYGAQATNHLIAQASVLVFQQNDKSVQSNHIISANGTPNATPNPERQHNATMKDKTTEQSPDEVADPEVEGDVEEIDPRADNCFIKPSGVRSPTKDVIRSQEHFHRTVNDKEKVNIKENNTSIKTVQYPQLPCWHHFNKTCSYGSRCRYSHNKDEYIELRKKQKIEYEEYKKNKKPNFNMPNHVTEDNPHVVEETVATISLSNSKTKGTPVVNPSAELPPFISASLSGQPPQETDKPNEIPTLYQQKDNHRKICWYYNNNNCIYGDRCRNLHQNRQEFPTVTYYPKKKMSTNRWSDRGEDYEMSHAKHKEPKNPPQEVTEFYPNPSKPVNTEGVKSSKRYYLDRDDPGTKKLCWWHNSEKCIYGVNCWYVNKEEDQYSSRQPFLVEAQQA